jgi:beta-lactamase superfamily II metal-dependent hydrolase
MVQGRVRAWRAEQQEVLNGVLATRHDRALFRKDFRAAFRQTATETGVKITDLEWGRAVDLLDWPSGTQWTRVRVGGDDGFVKTEHLVEIAYVKKTNGKNAYTAKLELANGDKVDLLWGDCVQVIERTAAVCTVRARGLTGTISSGRLTSDALLEIYFIDVGQGDGLLVRTPDGRHMVIDGGLPRSNQLTGKNAVDFIDWKCFFDYGDSKIAIDALVASHSDFDHYGGAWDLARQAALDDGELDALSVEIGAFYHPGLSRWEKRTGGPHPHKDDLGPHDGEFFLRLLGDREDAAAALVNGAADELGGDWRNFLKDLLLRNPAMIVGRVGVERETLQTGGVLPDLWTNAGGCNVRVLGPVSVRRGGKPALKDLGDTGVNTNGHSVCLRLDYGHARILLTGDLNTASMNWLMECYGDRIGSFACDVVKGCHHGSHDVSYRFLEQVKAGATIVSSGDNEGYAHPRPEIVAASATTGHLEIDRTEDRLVTPLVYMTEIERSVGVGALTHIRFRGYPTSAAAMDGGLFAQPFADIADKAFSTPADKAALQLLAAAQDTAKTRATFHYREVRGPFGITYGTRSTWRSRVMTKLNYGLVNVRTDGNKIICATMRETGGGWTVHDFNARF